MSIEADGVINRHPAQGQDIRLYSKFCRASCNCMNRALDSTKGIGPVCLEEMEDFHEKLDADNGCGTVDRDEVLSYPHKLIH